MAARWNGVLALSLLALAGVARADVVVSGNRQTGTRDCGGGTAVIDGNSVDLKLTDCRDVTVNGNSNRLDLGTAQNLTVLGNDNTITWTARDGHGPHVANLGSRNSIAEGKSTSAAPRAGASGASGGTSSAPKPPPPPGAPGGLVPPNIAAVAGLGGLSVASDGGHQTYDCKGGAANVTGNNNELVLNNCAGLNLSGDGNTIQVTGASSINVTGDDNKITWSGSGRPSIADTGDRNVISQKK